MVTSSPAIGVAILTGTRNPTVDAGITNDFASRLRTGIDDDTVLLVTLVVTPVDAGSDERGDPRLLNDVVVGDGDRDDVLHADEAVGFIKPDTATDVRLITYGGLPRSPSPDRVRLRSLIMVCGPPLVSATLVTPLVSCL